MIQKASSSNFHRLGEFLNEKSDNSHLKVIRDITINKLTVQ